MKATETKLLTLLQKSNQFTIPIYQRTYSWGKQQCLTLWNDIIRCGRDDFIHSHFLGSIVYVEAEQQQVSAFNTNLVIDGQQRLTSMLLLLEALARKMESEELIEGLNADKIRSLYLTNPYEKGNDKFKLRLTERDERTLNAIITGQEIPNDHSINIVENFEIFQNLIFKENGEFSNLCRGLGKLMIVDIALDRNVDNPQLIFESMNSTGKELSQADLIRNFVLMGHEKGEQDLLYSDIWRPIENDFGQARYDSDFDNFVRHYLTIQLNRIPRKSEVYQEFKYFFLKAKDALSTEEILLELQRYSRYYCAVGRASDASDSVSQALRSLNNWRNFDVAIPVLLELFEDRRRNLITDDELAECIRLIESYIFRRYVCEIPTNSMNLTFARFSQSLDKAHYVESFKAQFALLQTYKRFPDNREFAERLISKDMYAGPIALKYFLRRIENASRKEEVVVEDYTIEHIMPQNEDLSVSWQEELGENWKDIHAQKLHTIGNLTLTGYNSEYSDKPFIDKQSMKGGFRDSPLRVNDGLGEISRWDSNAMDERAHQLAKLAEELWKYPELPEETILKYLPEPKEASNEYSIKDHEYLVGEGKPKKLFNELRDGLLKLDSNIREEYKKLYVAFDADERIAEVVAKRNELKVYLNAETADLVDSRNQVEDVSEKGRWATGQAMFIVAESEDINYALDLASQVLANQIS